jgi:hypothetical protein
MRYPLKDIYITGPFFEQAVAGTGLKDHSGIARHIGVDLRAKVGTSVRAPDTGIVTQSYTAMSGNQIVEIHIGGYLWRFLHLSERLVKAGDKVQAGQIFAKSGNSGGVDPHLHIDVRKASTAWSDSLYNFIDPMSLLTKGSVLGSETQGENMAKPSKAEVRSAAKTYGRTFTEDEVTYYSERPWEELLNQLLPAVNAERLRLKDQLAKLQTTQTATLTKESVAAYLKDKGAI